MTALFIGRFQPFHIGHLSALKQITEEEIIIGIGSSQYSGTEDNPFTFEERKSMIEKALHEFPKPYSIIAIPDIHDEKNWVAHVRKLIPEFDVVYSGNDWVCDLFTEKNYTVKKIHIEIEISGTKLRKMMKSKNDTWKKYIPV